MITREFNEKGLLSLEIKNNIIHDVPNLMILSASYLKIVLDVMREKKRMNFNYHFYFH